MVFATLRLVHILFFRAVGKLFFYVFKKRRKIALQNVKRCGYKPAKKIVKKSFVNLGHTLGDFLLLKFYTNKNIDKFVRVKNIDYLEQAISKGKGVILSGAHFGSWELAAHYLALKGYKSLILYNKFKKPYWLDGVVKKQRERNGNRLVDKKNSFLSLYKHLKNGGLTVLLTDQHAAEHEGEKVKLLGQDVFTHTTFIKMSIKTEAPIVPAFLFVDGISKYTIKLFKPIDPKNYKSENAIKLMTRECNKALEKSIKKAPHLWMWQHRRFKDS